MRDVTNQNYIGKCTASESVSLSDTAENRYDALYVGTGGTIVMRLKDDTSDSTFVNVANGTILPFATKLVKSTSTTASNIIGLII